MVINVITTRPHVAHIIHGASQGSGEFITNRAQVAHKVHGASQEIGEFIINREKTAVQVKSTWTQIIAARRSNKSMQQLERHLTCKGHSNVVQIQSVPIEEREIRDQISQSRLTSGGACGSTH